VSLPSIALLAAAAASVIAAQNNTSRSAVPQLQINEKQARNHQFVQADTGRILMQ